MNLLKSEIMREASIFAGAVLSIYTVRSLQKPPEFKHLQSFPNVANSPLGAIMNNFAEFASTENSKRIFELSDDFLNHLSLRNQDASGFYANRLATLIPEEVKRACITSQYSEDMTVMTKALDFERDDLQQLQGICDDMVRNMLLE